MHDNKDLLFHAERAGVDMEKFAALRKSKHKGGVDKFFEKMEPLVEQIVEVWELPNMTPEMWDNYTWMFGDCPIHEEHKLLLKLYRQLTRKFGTLFKRLEKQDARTPEHKKKKKSGSSDSEGVAGVSESEGVDNEADAR